MTQKKHLDITIDIELYHHIKQTLPYGKISETVNELLGQFIQAKTCEVNDIALLDQEIAEKTLELERISSEITVLKIHKADLIKEQAIRQQEENEKSIAMVKSMLNAGVLRRLGQ